MDEWRGRLPAALGAAAMVVGAVVGTQLALGAPPGADAAPARAALSPYREGGFTVRAAAVDPRVDIASAEDGSWVLGHTPAGGDVVLDLDLMAGDTARPWWVDPADGRTLELAELVSEGVARFTVPGGSGNWVLVLDDATAGYDRPDPGEIRTAVDGGDDGSPEPGRTGTGSGSHDTGGSGADSNTDSDTDSDTDGAGGGGAGTDGDGSDSDNSDSDNSDGDNSDGDNSDGGGSDGSDPDGADGSEPGGSLTAGSGADGDGSGDSDGDGSGGADSGGADSGGADSSGTDSGSGDPSSSGTDTGGADRGEDQRADEPGAGDGPASGTDPEDRRFAGEGDTDTGGTDTGDAAPGDEADAPAAAPAPETPAPAPAPAPPAPAPEPAPAPDQPAGGPWDELSQCESSGDWAISTGNGYYGVIRTDDRRGGSDHCWPGLGSTLAGIWNSISATLISRLGSP